jgi:hypothetical protein
MPVLNVFGELERFTTEELYPLRYVITPLLIAAGLAVLYGAYRLGVHVWVGRHKAVSAAVGVPLLVVGLYAGDYLLSPLWERSYLEEASPLAVATSVSTEGVVPGTTEAPVVTESPVAAMPSPTPTASAGGASSPAAGGQQMATFEPMAVATGRFVGADDFHFGRGDAVIIETEPGKYVLRFENFSVRNGPDLFVYLSTDPSGESIDEGLNLGGLKATDGAFNYEIPAGIDVSQVKSAVVWCRQFSTLFAFAEFE